MAEGCGACSKWTCGLCWREVEAGTKPQSCATFCGHIGVPEDTAIPATRLCRTGPQLVALDSAMAKVAGYGRATRDLRLSFANCCREWTEWPVGMWGDTAQEVMFIDGACSECFVDGPTLIAWCHACTESGQAFPRVHGGECGGGGVGECG